MSIEKLPVFKNFPADKGQSKLVLWIKNKIFAPLSYRTNWLLDRVISDGFEIIPDGNAPGDDGNWRIIIVGANLEFQKRISGSWDVVFTIDG